MPGTSLARLGSCASSGHAHDPHPFGRSGHRAQYERPRAMRRAGARALAYATDRAALVAKVIHGVSSGRRRPAVVLLGGRSRDSHDTARSAARRRLLDAAGWRLGPEVPAARRRLRLALAGSESSGGSTARGSRPARVARTRSRRDDQELLRRAALRHFDRRHRAVGQVRRRLRELGHRNGSRRLGHLRLLDGAAGRLEYLSFVQPGWTSGARRWRITTEGRGRRLSPGPGGRRRPGADDRAVGVEALDLVSVTCAAIAPLMSSRHFGTPGNGRSSGRIAAPSHKRAQGRYGAIGTSRSGMAGDDLRGRLDARGGAVAVS